MPIKKTLYISSLGIVVEYIIGKNAKENFEIIDESDKHHIWFHLKDESSCHVIAKFDESLERKKNFIRHIVKQGALLCKQHSKLKSEKKVEVIYTTIENVKKTKILGSVNVIKTKIITLK